MTDPYYNITGVDVPASMEDLTDASPDTAFRRSQRPKLGNLFFKD